MEHIDLAAQYGMKFIRIGTNVTEVESSQKFIERAKGGMYVTANYMKSYAIHPTKFAELALVVRNMAQIYYVSWIQLEAQGGVGTLF